MPVNPLPERGVGASAVLLFALFIFRVLNARMQHVERSLEEAFLYFRNFLQGERTLVQLPVLQAVLKNILKQFFHAVVSDFRQTSGSGLDGIGKKIIALSLNRGLGPSYL